MITKSYFFTLVVLHPDIERPKFRYAYMKYFALCIIVTLHTPTTLSKESILIYYRSVLPSCGINNKEDE